MSNHHCTDTLFAYYCYPFTKKKKKIFFTGVIDDWKNNFPVAQNNDYDETCKEQMKDYTELMSNIKYE